MFYIITKWTFETTVLHLQPKNLADCLSSIAWQRKGGFTEEHCVCTYDAASGEFVCKDTNQRFKPSKGCYTQQAWDKFQASLQVNT